MEHRRLSDVNGKESVLVGRFPETNVNANLAMRQAFAQTNRDHNYQIL